MNLLKILRVERLKKVEEGTISLARESWIEEDEEDEDKE